MIHYLLSTTEQPSKFPNIIFEHEDSIDMLLCKAAEDMETILRCDEHGPESIFIPLHPHRVFEETKSRAESNL